MSARSQSKFKGRKVRLKSFNGTASSPPDQHPAENYWLLIGEEGVAIEPKNKDGRLLVQFSVSLGSIGLHNHNPVPNSLLIQESDLVFVD